MKKITPLQKKSKPKPTSLAEDAKVFLAHMDGVPMPRGYTTTTIRFPPTPAEMRQIRQRLGLSQDGMAKLFNTPKKTYQNWEQGLSRPDGAVTVLFNLVEARPEARKMIESLT